MATAMLDVGYLSTYLGLPPTTLNAVIDAPTADLLQNIFNVVIVKAREHDVLLADKLRQDIELENAVRAAETRVAGLRSSLDKAQQTVEECRTELNAEREDPLPSCCPI